MYLPSLAEPDRFTMSKVEESFMDQTNIQDQSEKRTYVKPSLTAVEIAARELLGTGGEPPKG